MSSIFTVILYLLVFYLCGTFLVSSLAYLYEVVKSIYLGVTCKNWLNVEGLISTSEIFVSSDLESGDLYRGVIIFDYCVEKQRFSHEGVSLTSPLAQSIRGKIAFANIKKQLEKYPKNKKVTVYYDPNNPNNAVLERGISLTTSLKVFYLFALSLLFGVVGAAGLFGLIHSLMNRSAF